MSKTHNFYVVIINNRTGEIIKAIGYNSYRMAEKGEDGVNINLNHNDYYTDIFSKEEYTSYAPVAQRQSN